MINELNVPSEIIELLTKEGLSKLYPPQVEAFRERVLEGGNVLLASPTASGKTLVAELCILKHILEKEGKAVYLTPLRALAGEKYEEFKKYSRIVKSNGERISVAISTGDFDSSDQWLGKFDIVLTTNEKADSLIRHKSRWLEDVTVVAADEIHLLTEPRRGPTLEVVLARLKQINPDIQLIALSATVENAEELADWMQAIPVKTDWRPVPLKEGVYCRGELMFKDGSSRIIEQKTSVPSIDVALESVQEGGQALIFTETRRSAVETSRKAAKALKGLLKQGKAQEITAERVLQAHEKTRLSDTLAEHVKYGGGFHHAGLSGEHRRIVEKAFREGVIKILSATPTLAAGVNLPARTVVLSSYERYEPGYGRYPISVLEYKQICGRAGRPKYDKYGEAILTASSHDELDFLLEKYVASKPEKLWSKLAAEKVLRPHVLSTIAMRFANSEEGLNDFFSKTFFAYQYGDRAIKSKLEGILKFLFKEGLIEIEGRRIKATRFGARVSELYIDPESAVVIRDGLLRGAESISELSFIHLVTRTPDLSPKLHPRRREKEELSTIVEEHKNEFLIDVPDPFSDFYDYEAFLAEVKTSNTLLDWMNELPEDGILKRYGAEPGDLLRLVELADWLLYAVEGLAPLFNRDKYRAYLERLRVRVSAGVKEELVPLVQLKGIGRVRARSLYNYGLRTISDLKKASIPELISVPMIGPEVTRKIKEQVGGKVSREDWERLKKTGSGEQRLISEYRI